MPPRGSATGLLSTLLLTTVLVVAAVSPAAAATTVPDGTHAERCFPSDGTEFVVGTEGPQIQFVLHLSLLPAVIDGDDPTDVTANTSSTTGAETAAPGALGIEAVATTGSARIVSLQSGVLFEGVEDATQFLTNPFAPFAFAFDYRLTIPAFEGTMADSEYRESDVPVAGPVEEAVCSR